MMSRKVRVNEVSRLKLATRCFSVIACLILSTVAAYGQGGSITGTINDPSGAAVVTASIDAKNVETGAVFHAGATSTGNYVVAVPAGTYEITVEAQGFKKFVRSNLAVQTSSTVRLDVALVVGAVTESVTVSEQTSLLKTESGEMSHVITNKQLNELAVITIGSGQGIRDPLQQIVLLPGTSYTNGLAFVVNGMPANSQSIRIEGQDSTGNIWKISQQTSQAGLDAIQETAIQTSNFAAEFGQAAGGYVNYTMKSGTNAFHGGGFDYLVNEGLNAGLPFSDRCVQDGRFCTDTASRQHIRNRMRRTDYGFTLGGPIWIPKLYDGSEQKFLLCQLRTIPHIQHNFNRTGHGSHPGIPQRRLQRCALYLLHRRLAGRYGRNLYTI